MTVLNKGEIPSLIKLRLQHIIEQSDNEHIRNELRQLWSDIK